MPALFAKYAFFFYCIFVQHFQVLADVRTLVLMLTTSINPRVLLEVALGYQGIFSFFPAYAHFKNAIEMNWNGGEDIPSCLLTNVDTECSNCA